jgi:hypothetical protein
MTAASAAPMPTPMVPTASTSTMAALVTVTSSQNVEIGSRFSWQDASRGQAGDSQQKNRDSTHLV